MEIPKNSGFFQAGINFRGFKNIGFFAV